MIKLPRTVKIGGMRLRVIATKKLKEAAGGNILMGQHSRWDGTIEVNTSMVEDQQIATLFHECLHHIFQDVGLHRELKEKMEERVVCAFETGVLALLRDNPKLAELMMPKKKKQKKKIKTKRVSY